MSKPAHKKKLIEVAMPIEAINAASVAESASPFLKGHPRSMKWWARRPLAACRGVLFAQLVDDPSANPSRFPTEELQEKERQRLFGIIEQLVKWENSNNESLLNEARAEIRRSCNGDPPPILDPFAGGGSIPLEAQRLGLDAYASDLNPVAVLINKSLIEIPPRWSSHRPVSPLDEGMLETQSWQGAQGLAHDVRWYGRWIQAEAERAVGSDYPAVLAPDGSTAKTIAWIWARTTLCRNPACAKQTPLVRSFWLARKKGAETWVRPVLSEGGIRFELGHGPDGPSAEGTVGRSGGICLHCSEPIPFDYIRSEGRAGRMGQQMMAICVSGARGRYFVEPTEADMQAAMIETGDAEFFVPDTDLPEKALGFRVQAYGLVHHRDLFTARQLKMIGTIHGLLAEVHERVRGDAVIAGLPADDVAFRDGGRGARAYADSILVLLTEALARCVMFHNSVCKWNVKNQNIANPFAMVTLSMNWDFPEANPFDSSTDFRSQSEKIAEILEKAIPRDVTREGSVSMADATHASLPAGVVVCTDPPYYDNVGYADLADFFYVWIRGPLSRVFPQEFGTLLVPKDAELVATPFRFSGDQRKADHFFEIGLKHAFANMSSASDPAYPMTVFYAYKQTEKTDGGEAVSTGWETMLAGLLDSGLMINGTWPLRTERDARSRGQSSNALASSIVLVCRPRPKDAGITDRRGFLEALRSELPEALREMQQGSVAPVDLAQSSIGPGMAVFSRYSKVLEPSGEPMRVRAALGLINQVLDEVLAEQEGDFDAETRWAVKWFSQYGFDAGPFGDAETLCKATGTAVNGMERSGILESKAAKVWLIGRADLPADWDPAADDRIPVWEAAQHLVKALDEGGEQAAAELLAALGGVGETARDLAYRLYAICDAKKWAKEAGMYNALVASWPEIRRKAAQGPSGQGSLL